MQKNLLHTLTDEFEGPMLFSYIWWILKQSQQKKIQRLYFLARDGYLLKQIAQEFCNRFQLPIECRYLYCSRTSLRMPSYHLIGDESYRYLLEPGYSITLRTLMKRADLTEEEMKRVCKDCGCTWKQPDQVLGKKEFQQWSQSLRNSLVYKELVMKKSMAAYETAIGYLRQEIPSDLKKFAIVDSGWLGSMQFFLARLLHSMGFQGEIEGFYFGLYTVPSDYKSGKYYAWYFDASTGAADKASFCNNLFECLLGAPHGMTTAYVSNGNGFSPVLQAAENYSFFSSREEALLQYTKNRLETTDFDHFQEKEQKEQTRKLIRRYMMYPSQEEVKFYGTLRFSDDITALYTSFLVESNYKELLRNCLISRRILSFLKISKRSRPTPYWPYGAIAFLPQWKKWWYRKNVYWWEWIRCYIIGRNS